MTTVAILPPRATGLRLFELVGDGYEPALRGGDLLMVADANRFLYDGEYLLNFGDGEAPYRATSQGDRVHIRHPNPRYLDHHVSKAEFDRAVRAIVVAEVKVKDARRMRAAYSERVAA